MIKTFDNGFTIGEFILNNGENYLFTADKQFILETAEEVFDEDYKTALVKGNPSIPKGTKVILRKFFKNLYGEFFAVNYNGYLFYAKPSCFNYVKLIEK